MNTGDFGSKLGRNP